MAGWCLLKNIMQGIDTAMEKLKHTQTYIAAATNYYFIGEATRSLYTFFPMLRCRRHIRKGA